MWNVYEETVCSWYTCVDPVTWLYCPSVVSAVHTMAAGCSLLNELRRCKTSSSDQSPDLIHPRSGPVYICPLEAVLISWEVSCLFAAHS